MLFSSVLNPVAKKTCPAEAGLYEGGLTLAENAGLTTRSGPVAVGLSTQSAGLSAPRDYLALDETSRVV